MHQLDLTDRPCADCGKCPRVKYPKHPKLCRDCAKTTHADRMNRVRQIVNANRPKLSKERELLPARYPLLRVKPAPLQVKPVRPAKPVLKMRPRSTQEQEIAEVEEARRLAKELYGSYHPGWGLGAS